MSQFVDDDRVMPRFRVNRQAMVDPEVFARERDEIFDKVWLYLGHETELRQPGDATTRTVAGRQLIFCRDAGGATQAWFTDPRSDAAPSVAPARVDAYRGFVFVSFNPEVEPLVDYLAGAREYLDLIADQSEEGMQILEGTHEYSVKANWKLLVENSVDGYHAVSTHQRYFEMIVAAGVEFGPRPPGTSRGMGLGNGHSVVAGGPGTGGIFGRPLSEQAAAEREARFDTLRARYGDGWVDRLTGARNLVIFPNLVVIDLVMGVVVRKIDPVTPDYMEVTAWELIPPEEGDELKQQRLDNFLTFWGPGGLASPDDVEALETCQRSFASFQELPWSDISRGMLNPVPEGNEELQMRTWWRRWNELITGEVLPPEVHDAPAAAFTAQRPDLAAASRI